MIPFTSRFDGFVKVFIALPIFFCIWMGIGDLLQKIVLTLMPRAEGLSNIISTIGGLILAFIVQYKLIAIHLHTLSSFLYLRLSLGIKVSWQEARYLAFLFSVNKSGKWYPLKEVKKIPKEKRKAFVCDFAAKILKQR